MVVGQPTTGLFATLVAVNLDELTAQFRGAEQIGIGACNGFGGELDAAFPRLELLGHRRVHHLFGGSGVIDAGVIGHSERITLGIDPPVAVLVLLPEVVLG